MPRYDRFELERRAREYGFVRDTFEKVLRLKHILAFLNRHDYLKDHLLLKGGTAINLTVFQLPRLSVDIDLDFTPNEPREDMLASREKINGIIISYMQSEGYDLSPNSRFYHSLDSYYFNYVNAIGNRDLIKLELNYSLRAHILEAEERGLTIDAFGENIKVKTLDPMEIFASKANALLSRAAARDLYDFDKMIQENLFSQKTELFRKCIIFYAAVSAETINKSFSTDAIETITLQKIRRDLFPVLRKEERTQQFDVNEKILVAKQYLNTVMKVTDSEKEFLHKFERKEYIPGLLFEDESILKRIAEHPMALWKCRK